MFDYRNTMKNDHLVKPRFIEKKSFFVILWLFECFCYFWML